MTRRLPLGPLLLLAAAAVGCPQNNPVQTVNQPPRILLEQPTLLPEETEIEVELGGGVNFVAVANDAEDLPEDLVIHWLAERTDIGGVEQSLGDSTPDSDGRATQLIAGLDAGRWQVTARVEDTRGATDEVSMPVLVLAQNEAPGVLISQPLQGSTFTGGDTITFVATATDDRGVTNLDIEWFSSLDGLIDSDPPISNGLLTFSRDDLSVGEQTVTLRATDPEGLTGETFVNFTIDPLNRPPSAPQVAINPGNPLTTDDLLCLIVIGSSDPEGDAISYSYRWFRDGLQSLITAADVPASQTTQGEDWTCEVTATDGILDSVAGTATVTIGNIPPEAEGAILSPDPAYETTVLHCTPFGWSDGDGDAEGYLYEWYVNGTLIPAATGDSLDGTFFDRADTVQCHATPWDGIDAGLPVDSNIVSIGNSAPTAPAVSISPVPEARDNENLVCTVTTDATDPDGDAFVYEVEWLRDGVADLSYDGLWVLPAAATELGETWTCSVTADDLADEGPPGTASTIVLPQPGDFVITEFMATPQAVSSAAGEWVEIYNASTMALNLRNFVIHDDNTDSHTINADLIVPPSARIVLARNGDFATNGGVFAAYEYSGFVLADTQDQIVLSFGPMEIDRFNYDLTLYSPPVSGRALALSPAVGTPSMTVNDPPTNWCGSSNPITIPGSDFGTPGGANDSCLCYYSDIDLDGYGTDASCGWVDCNDNNPSYSPEATDYCENSIDENCDGADAICPCLATDNDGDGYGDGLACNPTDCNDGNSGIYPGAAELCNTIDENCDTVPDNGNPLSMCPATNNVTNTYCSGGGCYVQTCAGGFYDINGLYADGCECGNDGYASSCSAASSGVSNLGNVGGTVVVTAKLPTPSSVDWYRVQFSANGRGPGQGTPVIEFLTNPSGVYRIHVYDGCGGNVLCNGGTDWSFTDNQSPGYTWNPTTWPSDVWIRVSRVSSGNTCENYQLRIRRP